MLLQKTGWRIKQFISHRKNYSADDSAKDLRDGPLESKTTLPCGSKRLLWLSQTSSSEKPRVQRTSSIATTHSNPLLPAIRTGSSSATSLCSLESDANALSIQHSLSSVGPAAPTSPDILCLPLSSSPGIANDATNWRLERSNGLPLQPTSPLSGTLATESTFNLIEALAINPDDEDETPIQSLRNAVVSDAEYLSNNVEQLIRETDKAFQPCGPVLTFVKAPTQATYETTTITRITPRTAASRRVLQKQTTLLGSSINTSVSLSRGERRTPDWRKMSPMDESVCLSSPLPTTTSATWTLADVTKNVVDMFGGKLFRGKGDDILRPGFVQRTREGAEVESDPKASMDLDRFVEADLSTLTDTSVESISPRIISTRGKSSPLSNLAQPLALSKNRTRYTSARISQPRGAKFARTSSDDARMVFKNLDFPSPPRMPRSLSENRNSLVLSTIPEVEPLPVTQSLHSDKTLKHHESSLKPSSCCLNLPSTTLTLTSPLFRHGFIRLERSPSQEKDLSPDGRLDWTAFQMAISGSIDDHDLYEDLWRSEADEAELDDIMEWWIGFGIQGLGSLVRGPSEYHKRTGDENISSIEGTGWKAGLVDRESMNEKHSSEIGSCKVEKRQDAIVESLPPSPILDLVDLVSKSDETIPMGYNIGPGLDDYLNWEAQYV